MIVLKIFNRNKYHFVNRNSVIFSIFILFSIPFFINYYFNISIFKYDSELLIFAIFILFIASIVSLTQIEDIIPLKGKIVGSITLVENEIFINNDLLNWDNINGVVLENNDYVGRISTFRNYADFRQGKSNGTDNKILIFYKNKSKEKYFFIQENMQQKKKVDDFFKKFKKVKILN